MTEDFTAPQEGLELFSDWHEYARETRFIHVTCKPCALGNLYTAYLPNGYIHTTTDLEYLQTILPVIECRRLEIVGAA